MIALVVPQHLQDELDEVNERLSDAETDYNAVQHRIALWHCSEGRHVYCNYHSPPIGVACIHCRAPDPQGRSSNT